MRATLYNGFMIVYNRYIEEIKDHTNRLHSIVKFKGFIIFIQVYSSEAPTRVPVVLTRVIVRKHCPTNRRSLNPTGKTSDIDVIIG